MKAEHSSPISNLTCSHTKLTEGCPCCFEWATGTPANIAKDECERCKHLENKCRDWAKRFEKKANELVGLQVKSTWLKAVNRKEIAMKLYVEYLEEDPPDAGFREWLDRTK